MPPSSNSTQLFREIPTENKHARIQTNEAFPGRKTNPADFNKLEGCNPKRPRICSPM